jgi:hypothetical protein
LLQLREQFPILRQICDRVDKNFYQYLREKGRIVHLPKNCINGLAVSTGLRKNHTISFLVAGAGDVEKPGDILDKGVRRTMSETKDRKGKSQRSEEMVRADLEDIGGEAEEYFDCLED